MVDVTMEEFSFAIPERELAAGTYTFMLGNAGSAPHAMAIRGPGISGEQQSETISGGENSVHGHAATWKLRGVVPCGQSPGPGHGDHSDRQVTACGAMLSAVNVSCHRVQVSGTGASDMIAARQAVAAAR
jgi:hypothetical protein